MVDPTRVLAPRPSMLDYDRMQADFDLKKQYMLANQQLAQAKIATGANLPAPMQIANRMFELEQAMANPNLTDQERYDANRQYNLLGQSAKTYGFQSGIEYGVPQMGRANVGIIDGLQGRGGTQFMPPINQATPIGGFGGAAGSIAAEKKRQEELAKDQAAAQANIDSAKLSSETMLKAINDLSSHPGFSSVVGAKGASQLFGLKDEPFGGTDAAGAKAIIDQIKGGTFLEGFQRLKGAGAITEIEGLKGEQAIARLSTAQSEADFKKSLKDLQDIVEKGYENLQKKATGDYSIPGALAMPQQLALPPMPENEFELNNPPVNVQLNYPAVQLGQIEDGYVYMGGDPASPSSWKELR